MELDIDQVIRSAQEIKPLPQSVSRLAGLIADDETDFDEVVEVITFDASLTMQLLRSANSAASGSAGEISNVKDAVVRLGTGAVLCLAVGSSVRGMASDAIPEFNYLHGEFWRHSVVTALAAQRLNHMCAITVPPESFTAGLLHDFGKLVMCQFLGPDQIALMHRAHDEGSISYAQAEMELFGITHADVGGAIAKHWKLPESIVRGIVFHHTPSSMPDLICYVVHLANAVARIVEKAETETADAMIEPATWESVGMDPEKLNELCDTVANERDATMALYGQGQPA